MDTLTAVGLGPRTLTAVTVRADSQSASIVAGGSAPLASTDPESIRKGLDDLGVSDARAFLMIPRGQSLLKDLELPEGPADELVSMVRYQVEREMPLPVEQIRYSYVETGRAQGKVRVQVAAVSREVLEGAVRTLDAAGVKVCGAYVSSFGLVSLCRNVAPSALVEISGDEAEIVVVDQGRMEFSRTAPLDGAGMAETLAEEVDRTLLAYAAKSSGKTIEKVILAGEGDEAAKLAEEMRARLGKEVAQVGPGDLRTAAVAGICLGVSRGSAMPDLLRPPVAVKQFRLTRLHCGITAAVLALGALVAAAQVALAGRQEALRDKLDELRAREPQAAEVARLSQQAALAQQWYRDRYPWVKTFDALGKVVGRESLWIATAAFEDTGTVRLVGKAREDKHVTDLVAALGKTEYFEQVTLKEIRPNTDKGEYRKDFTVTARLRGFLPPAAPRKAGR